MNTAYTARPATHSAAAYFTQDSQSLTNSTVLARSNTGRYTSEMSVMGYKKGNSRAHYASVLYAAALAALLSACTKTDVAVEAAPKAVTIHLSEGQNTADTADMQEVVVSASREHPKAIG